jgi:hypothetical protein
MYSTFVFKLIGLTALYSLFHTLLSRNLLLHVFYEEQFN